ncbi:MAG: hypothetical protein ABIP57_07475 [Jatrophihabitantaceae bacterium]
MAAPAEDTGPDFEDRALALARAIYDPSGSQGATMVDGLERDAVFTDARSVVAFEFTTDKAKAKAEKDGVKLRDLLKKVAIDPQHRNKAIRGIFLTQHEPTADQRDAIRNIARQCNLDIVSMGYLTLRRSLIDTESYIALRRNAPFGSTSFVLGGTSAGKPKYVYPRFTPAGTTELASFADLMAKVAAGGRFVITADFGSGKSAALQQMFEERRKLFFKAPDAQRFPVHINLRDCYGLKSPAEILRRHTEDVGFGDDRSLVAAWRAGACDLLLDGFDELVPSRWVGGARDLAQVRWNALDAVRRLVADTPPDAAVVVCGRAQFFSADDELSRCLGLASGDHYVLNDFDSDQVVQIVGPNTPLPEWVPTRPLLLQFLVRNDLLRELEAHDEDARAWLAMLKLVADREADRITSITPDRILTLIARIATASRGATDGSGSLSIEEMRRVFREVCGYDPEEEGLQLLLRLPGLASWASNESHGEARRFVDQVLADAAYGLDLASYTAAPFSAHPLADAATWVQAAGGLTARVAAARLLEQKYDAGVVGRCIQERMAKSYFDVVLMDCVQTGAVLDTPVPKGAPPLVVGVLVRELVLHATGVEAAVTYSDCLIERLDVVEIEATDQIPTFQSCLIDQIDGWSKVPDVFTSMFSSSEIGALSPELGTTAGLASLKLPPLDRVALVILKKVYAQAGSGRRSSALARGLSQADRGLVPDALAALAKANFVSSASGRSGAIILPVRDKRSKVMEILALPSSFKIGTL